MHLFPPDTTTTDLHTISIPGETQCVKCRSSTINWLIDGWIEEILRDDALKARRHAVHCAQTEDLKAVFADLGRHLAQKVPVVIVTACLLNSTTA